MNKQKGKRIFEIGIQALATVLFATLIVLTATVISVFGKSNLASDSVPFDLDMITAKKSENSEIDGYLLPEFIGIGLGSEQYGISVSSNIVAEIYGMLSPTLSHLISSENFKEADADLWLSFTESDKFVYVRYHSQLTDNIIGIFADAASNAEGGDRNHVLAYVYELIVIPAESKDGNVRIAVRSLDGVVALFEGEAGVFEYERLSNAVTSYKSSFSRFVFSSGKYNTLLDTEPVFIDSVSTREILLSADTGMIVLNNDSYKEPLMRLFSINPDKLLSKSVDINGNLTYTDIHGVLSLRMSGFEYQSVQGGGIDIEKIIGYTDEIGLKEYIRAATELISSLRTINKFFIGSDADTVLCHVTSDGGRVKLIFEYAYDNVRITGENPAFEAEFEGGKLKYARVTAIAAKALITKVNSYSESWFLKSLDEGIVPQNVSLVYEGDYLANSVSAKWAALVPSDK